MPTTTLNLCFVLAPGYSRLCRCNQSQKQATAGPDISLLRPELQRQWYHAKNQHLGDRQIKTSSNLRVWWTCDQCPSGLPHEWLATVNARQNMNSQCPYCTNNSLCQHNSLLTVASAVAVYWDTARNGLTPDQVLARSHTRMHWLCPNCHHSWQANICVKVDNQSFERNRRAGLDPDKITAGSGKMVHWICTKCPKGRPHLFVAPPFHRMGGNHGCPYCANKKACICNSLQTLYPELAAEYDTARNGVGPEQVLSRSNKMAFWKDASGHTWEQTPFSRTKPEADRSKRAAIKSGLKQQA